MLVYWMDGPGLDFSPFFPYSFFYCRTVSPFFFFGGGGGGGGCPVARQQRRIYFFPREREGDL